MNATASPLMASRVARLACVVTLVFAGAGHATTYCVDINHPSASDENPGTVGLPWRTIQHASETMVAGDTVLIRAGIYTEHVHTEHDGNDMEGSIVFSAYPGETPIIDGIGVEESQNCIVVDKSYITLNGLEIRNWNDNGVWVEGAAYLEISDCIVHDVWCGIGLAHGAHDFEMNRIVVHHFMLYGFDASPSGGAACHHGTFNECISHTGSDPQQNVDGFAIGHGTQHDFVFNRCETYGVYDGFDIGENEGGGASNVLLNCCSAHECGNGGFKLWGHQVTLVNCLAYHNTVSNIELDWGGNPGTTVLHSCTLMDAGTYNVWVENSSDSLRMYNCILAGNDNIGLAFEQRDARTYQGDHNIFHDDDGDRVIIVGYEDEFSLDQVAAGDWAAYSGQDAHSRVVYSLGDLFVDPVSFDLHVLETSVAVDNGTATDAPPVDHDGNPRPAGSGYDIGAFEHQFGAHGHGPSQPMGSPHAYLMGSSPNPFSHVTTICYSLPQGGAVSLGVYDLLGRRVKSLVGGPLEAGVHQTSWDGCDDWERRCPGGLYFCRLRVRGTPSIHPLVVAR
ncbi:hypothetical protein JXA88_01730 [Candidatus Fermentibacteria bacterium]|nr:hypothetical protein [Candidatus Fermentibacteria bacterium]